MEIRGGLSTYELSTVEKDTFAEYLQHSMNNPALEFIRYLLGDDYIKFIDVMSGTVVKIPSAKSLERDLESVKIFLYVKRNGFTELSIKEAAKAYNKSALTAKRYTLKVSKVLGIEDTLEGDDLNNYITYIKSVEESDSYYQTKVEARQDELRVKRREAMEKSSQEPEVSEKEIEDTKVKEEVVETPTYTEDSYTLEDFWSDRKDNIHVNALKSLTDNMGNVMVIRERKSGKYIRIMKDDGKHPLIDCVLNRSGWIIDFFFLSEEGRDKSKAYMTDVPYVKDYGKKAITIRRMTDSNVIKRLIDVTQKEGVL